MFQNFKMTMNISKPVGGRGIKAPYETTHVRVPVGLKPKFEKEIDTYRGLVLAGKLDPNQLVEKLDDSVDDRIMFFSEALAEAKKIISQKKSSRQSLAKLLTAIYGVDVDPKKL